MTRPDGTYTAVVDHFEDNRAVLVVEGDGEPAGELVVEESRLPEAGRIVDSVLTVEVMDGELVSAAYEESATTERAEDTQSRFDRLSNRLPSDEDQ